MVEFSCSRLRQAARSLESLESMMRRRSRGIGVDSYFEDALVVGAVVSEKRTSGPEKPPNTPFRGGSRNVSCRPPMTISHA